VCLLSVVTSEEFSFHPFKKLLQRNPKPHSVPSVAVEDSNESDDTYRPHKGVKIKTKLCMKCRHTSDAVKEAEKFGQQQVAALKKSMKVNAAGKKAAAAAEDERQAAAKAVGDPAFGSDPNNHDRVALDAALMACLKLPKIARAVCLEGVKGPAISIPNPASLDPSDKISVRLPTDLLDPRKMAPDPMAVIKPYTEGDPDPSLKSMRPPFQQVLLEVEKKKEKDPYDNIDTKMYLKLPAAPPQVTKDLMVPLAELDVCVNEGSRYFVYSLFRGIVGPSGDIECVDIPADPVEATAG
jgi:hypothetical protein